MSRRMTVDEYFVKIDADISELKRELTQAERKTKQTGDKMSGSLQRIGGAIAAAFSVQALISFSRQVIEVRSQFERFEAVLGNSLGSKGVATLIMGEIKQMAIDTPYQVSQITDAFMRLTNYGMQPTLEELKQLGDVSSSVGKGLVQMSEALADAAVGEWERMKEFGVKARQHGDRVTVTFRGVTKEIGNNAAEIKKYVTEMGLIEGVQGSMQVQMEALGGKVSNLGDAWASLLNTIGDTSAWGNVITGLKDTVSWTEKWIKASGQMGFINPMDAFASYQMQVGSIMADFRKRNKAIMQATAEAMGKAGVTPAGPLMPGQERTTMHGAGFVFGTKDPITGLPIVADKGKLQATEKRLTEEQQKAVDKLRRETVKASVALTDLRIATEMSNKANMNFARKFSDKINAELGTGGFKRPQIITSDYKFEDAAEELESMQRGDIRMVEETNVDKWKDAVGDEMLDLEASALGLADGLAHAAQDMDNAGDIMANTIAQIIGQMIAQAAAAQLGALAGPLGGLITGGLSMALKGKDLETSRSRTANSIARYN